MQKQDCALLRRLENLRLFIEISKLGTLDFMGSEPGSDLGGFEEGVGGVQSNPLKLK